MNPNSINKIIGYALLIVGLLLIIMPIYQTYNIFLGKSLPPDIFKSQELTINQNVSPMDVQKQIENAFIKILPVESINKTLDLTAWSLLVLIFIFGGKQISEIGIKLIKVNQQS